MEGWAVLTGSAVNESRHARSKAAAVGRRCALIAGADPSIRQLLRTVLEIGGFDVLEAASQSEVLGRLATTTRMPHVVIVDVLLPSFSGLSTLAYLRRDPRLARVPVIVLSSYAEPPEQQQFLQSGASAVVTKPFSSQRLLDLIHQFVTAS
jgi:CheY-like chemotaxis protein